MSRCNQMPGYSRGIESCYMTVWIRFGEWIDYPAGLWVQDTTWKAILMHEMGHVIDFYGWGRCVTRAARNADIWLCDPWWVCTVHALRSRARPGFQGTGCALQAVSLAGQRVARQRHSHSASRGQCRGERPGDTGRHIREPCASRQRRCVTCSLCPLACARLKLATQALS